MVFVALRYLIGASGCAVASPSRRYRPLVAQLTVDPNVHGLRRAADAVVARLANTSNQSAAVALLHANDAPGSSRLIVAFAASGDNFGIQDGI